MKRKFIIPLEAYYLLLLLGLSKNEKAIDIIEEATNTIRSEKCSLRERIYLNFHQEYLFSLIDRKIKIDGINSLNNLKLSLKYKIYFIFLESLLNIHLFIKIGFQFSLISAIEIIKERFIISKILTCRRSNIDRRTSSVKDRLKYGIYLSVSSYKNNKTLDKILINQSFKRQLMQDLYLEISRYVFFHKNSSQKINPKNVLEESISKTCESFQGNNVMILIDELIDNFTKQIFEEFNVEMLDRRNKKNRLDLNNLHY